MGTTRVKICGLSEPVTLAAAIDAGAAYVGFVFVRKSPRYITLEQASDLAKSVKPGVAKVALTVNASDEELTAITDAVPLDMLQLHGNETPERVLEVKARFGLPVMKAFGMASAEDLDRLPAFEAVADQILLDAKPPKEGALPGGNGLTFDWTLIAGRRWLTPWMLAGGLTPENVAEAVRLTGAKQVDLSSSLETSPGIKDEGLIRAFMAACP